MGDISCKVIIDFDEKKDKFYIKAEGDKVSLLYALSEFVKILKENNCSKDSIYHSIGLAFMTDEELEEDFKKEKKRNEELINMFSKLFNI